MKFPVSAVALLVLVSVTSCKKTYRDIGHEPGMVARVDAFIQEMAEISEAFPKELTPLPEYLHPKLCLTDGTGRNALMEETFQLGFMDSDVGFGKEEYFGLGTTRHLRRLLEDRHDGQNEAPEGYKQQLEGILELRYIVAVDVNYLNPKIVDKQTYTGGSVSAQVAVYDRETSSWLGGFECEAKPQMKVEFKTKADGFFERDGLYALKSDVLGSLLKEIKIGLEPISESQPAAE